MVWLFKGTLKNKISSLSGWRGAEFMVSGLGLWDAVQRNTRCDLEIVQGMSRSNREHGEDHQGTSDDSWDLWHLRGRHQTGPAGLAI